MKQQQRMYLTVSFSKLKSAFEHQIKAALSFVWEKPFVIFCYLSVNLPSTIHNNPPMLTGSSNITRRLRQVDKEFRFPQIEKKIQVQECEAICEETFTDNACLFLLFKVSV